MIISYHIHEGLVPGPVSIKWTSLPVQVFHPEYKTIVRQCFTIGNGNSYMGKILKRPPELGRSQHDFEWHTWLYFVNKQGL